MKRADKVFWAILIAICAVFVALFIDGFTHAEAIEPEQHQQQEIACDSEPTSVETITVVEFMSRARDAWESIANQHESDSEDESDEEYTEEYYEYQNWDYASYSGSEYAYTGGSTATSMHDLVNGQGRAYDDNGTSYTYFYDVCGDLDIPGEHKDSDGVSYDGDGYIVVAADGHDYGDVIDTPYGEGKVYDKGSGYGNVDIYVG